MKTNLFIFSFSIIISNFTGYGISTYEEYGIFDKTRSFFYATNSTAIFGLVMAIYFFYKISDNNKNVYYVILSLIGLFLSGTKTIILVPFLYLYILAFKIIKKKWIRIIIVPSIFIFIILSIFSILNSGKFVNNFIFNKYESRIYQSARLLDEKRLTITNPLLKYYSYISAGRSKRANEGLINFYNEPENFFFGYGFSMLSKKVGYRYAGGTGSEMDIIDILLRYGVIGFFLIYMPIFTIIIPLIRKRKTDVVSFIIYIIFLYSTFAGHTITAPMSGSVFALFLGLGCPFRQNRIVFSRTMLM